MKKELLDEIINLKSRKQVLEVECGLTNLNVNTLSHEQMHAIEEDTARLNAFVALEAINQLLESDEVVFRQM